MSHFCFNNVVQVAETATVWAHCFKLTENSETEIKSHIVEDIELIWIVNRRWYSEMIRLMYSPLRTQRGVTSCTVSTYVGMEIHRTLCLYLKSWLPYCRWTVALHFNAESCHCHHITSFKLHCYLRWFFVPFYTCQSDSIICYSVSKEL